jgi:2-alkenal reductase
MPKSQRYLSFVSASLVLAVLACSVSLPTPTQETGRLPTAAPSSTPLSDSDEGGDVEASTQPVLPTLTPLPAAPLLTSTEEQQLIALYDRSIPSRSHPGAVGDQGFAQGTGFVFDTDGHVVTNQHVVDGGTDIEVDFLGPSCMAGIGTDPMRPGRVELSPLIRWWPAPGRLGQRAGGQWPSATRLGCGTMTVNILRRRPLAGGNRQVAGGGRFTTPDILQTDAAISSSPAARCST